ncbi:MAG: hypothetical protein MUC48_05490 [Leptolyngbya sp. Prado105]|jgi:hypothetical protein|nr:hypothetical protein [Leptolyngbya sp. Prado105]
MDQTVVSLKRAFAIGAILLLSIAQPSLAHTPRGSNGLTPGSEIVPPSLPPQFTQDILRILQALRSGNPSQRTIAEILQSTGRLYRYNEAIGKLKATISQSAVPPNEPGIEPESLGLVRLDLQRDDSMPGSIAARFARYVNTLGNQNGQFRIFGNDRQGVSREMRVEILPKSEGQVELQFTSKDATGNPKTETILAPNADVAAVLAGLISALDLANASSFTLQAATKMVLSLGQINLTLAEIEQLSQSLTESLIATESMLAGCGESAVACTTLNMNGLKLAIQSYNRLVNETNGSALLALSKNPEFQILGNTLRQIRATLASQTGGKP